MDLFKHLYYWLDLIIGFGAPIIVYILYKRKAVDRSIWLLFWIGSVLGLAWEVPIFILSAATDMPVIIWVRELPLHYIIFLISHTLWDGALFLLGMFLVHLFCKSSFYNFNFKELLIFIIYGQASALLVELSSVLNDAWVYVGSYWWNPVLFQCNSHPVTILPQVIWLIAPVVLYSMILKIKHSMRISTKMV